MTSFHDLRLIAQIDNQCKELGYKALRRKDDELRRYSKTYNKNELPSQKHEKDFASVQVVITCAYIYIIIVTTLSYFPFQLNIHEIEYLIKLYGSNALKISIFEKLQRIL